MYRELPVLSKKADNLCRQGRDVYTPAMHHAPAAGPPGVSRSDLARILSPLLLFLAHVAYLLLWSPDPFFNKWIDGSFSFFLALVLCNVIRSRIQGAARQQGDDTEEV